jgi:hypothetical protein
LFAFSGVTNRLGTVSASKENSFPHLRDGWHPEFNRGFAQTSSTEGKAFDFFTRICLSHARLFFLPMRLIPIFESATAGRFEHWEFLSPRHALQSLRMDLK